MPNINEIEELTKAYSDERQKLSDRIRQLEDEIQSIKRKRLPVIKATVQAVMTKQEVLKAALEVSRTLFVKPRTAVFHGVKVGFQKGKGKLSWVDDAVVVKLIKKHFPDQVDVLIKTTEKPIKAALENMDAADLKKLGITVNDTDDQIVIKSTDSEIDKFVESLLKEDECGEEAA
ncbi:MAG: hypothetical protein EG826_04380 [Deltaproteobacteria bacterium]|nr:hypothetical protein [Deltaproteobacteria bacterium]